MVSRTRRLVEEMLSRAEAAVAEGERRLEAQKARVATLEKAGRAVEQSRRLLKIMDQAQTLQRGHVAMLKRDLARPDYAVPLPLQRPPSVQEEWRNELLRPGSDFS